MYQSKRFGIILIWIIIIVTSCDASSSLKFKKVYALSPDKVTVFGASVINSIQEIELNFVDDKEVDIRVIVCYDCFFSGKKKPSSGSVKHNYIYSEGNLQIPALDMNTKLEDSGDKYICDDSSIFYKTSILELNREQKEERINKEFNYPRRIEKFLDNEYVYKKVVVNK